MSHHVKPEVLLGLDFSCAPSPRKPLTLAWGRRVGQVVKLDKVDAIPALAGFEALLRPPASAPVTAAPAHSANPSPDAAKLANGFVMACDFPFGLPRAFVAALASHGPGTLPRDLADHPVLKDQTQPPEADSLIQALHRHCANRAGFQQLIDGWGETWQAERGKAGKLLHRLTDRAVPGIASTSPLQTRYVPVGKMYFEGMARLVAADLSLPGLRQGRPDAIALEAYPGLLSGEILGRRSYKSDANTSDATKAHDRLIARMDLVDALEQGRTRLGLRLKLTPAQRDQLVSDAMGDRLDAALCLMQAAWAHWRHEQGDARWGLPPEVDPVEGWILTA